MVDTFCCENAISKYLTASYNESVKQTGCQRSDDRKWWSDPQSTSTRYRKKTPPGTNHVVIILQFRQSNSTSLHVQSHKCQVTISKWVGGMRWVVCDCVCVRETGERGRGGGMIESSHACLGAMQLVRCWTTNDDSWGKRMCPLFSFFNCNPLWWVWLY